MTCQKIIKSGQNRDKIGDRHNLRADKKIRDTISLRLTVNWYNKAQ